MAAGGYRIQEKKGFSPVIPAEVSGAISCPPDEAASASGDRADIGLKALLQSSGADPSAGPFGRMAAYQDYAKAVRAAIDKMMAERFSGVPEGVRGEIAGNIERVMYEDGKAHLG